MSLLFALFVSLFAASDRGPAIHPQCLDQVIRELVPTEIIQPTATLEGRG